MAALFAMQSFMMFPFQVWKSKVIVNSAYESLKSLDLVHLRSIGSEADLIDDVLTDKMHCILMDDQFNLLFSDDQANLNKDQQSYFKQKKDLFSENATAVYEKEPFGERVTLYGKIRSGDSTCYLCLYQRLMFLSYRISFARGAVLWMMGIVVLISMLILFFLLKHYLDPLGEMRIVLERLRREEYSARILGKMPSEQTQDCADGINELADRLVRNRTSIRNMKYVMRMGLPSEHDLDEAERNVTAKITHQLKTPLAIISSQIELSQDETDPEKREYYYNSIMDEIDKLSLLISEILQTMRGKQQDTGFVICRQPISTNIAVLCQKYENWLAASDIRFKSNVEDDVCVKCDWIQIEQVLNNYMMNAFKHTKAGKTIALTLRKESKDVYIGVHNEGEWVPEADIERVWKSYYQGAGEQSDTEIGLGLYIVKDIMKKHHGSYGLFNDATGVEFYLRLPLCPDEADCSTNVAPEE
jgi:signal transduction histidine kinase